MRRVFVAIAGLAFAFCAAGASAKESPWPSAGIRPAVYKAAMLALAERRSAIDNPRYVTIVDYGLPSNKPRLFVLDRETGKVKSYLVAHGKGSDPDFDGVATQFSNELGSEMSSLGTYVTGETYVGTHGLSLRLKGLDATNDKAEERAIVFHGADYVGQGRKVLGRSWGCPAVERRFATAIIEKIRGGSLLFIHN